MPRYLPLLLLLPATAFAQTPEVVAKVDAKLDAERTAQRNEDVEILRRLLNKAAGLPDQVKLTFPVPSALAETEKSPRSEREPRTSAPIGPFDGVYLPGAGVVFTLHVPAGTPLTAHADRIGLNSACSTCHQPQVHAPHATSISLANCTACHSDVPKDEAKLSDWDRVKQDVRGDKSKPADKPKGEKTKVAVCEPGNLPALVAGVLAGNAKNVRHLGEKEGVTVVVTLDGVAAGEKQVFWQGAMLNDATGEMWSPPAAQPTAPPATKGWFTPDEVKALNLGDLHLKQGKHKEAADAYATALARFTAKEFKLSGLAKLTAEERRQYADRLQGGVRDAMKNYAKALLLADQTERAKEALDMATGFVVLEVSPVSTPAANTAPAKLVVSVCKADIESAKDTAALKKLVKVERVNFPK